MALCGLDPIGYTHQNGSRTEQLGAFVRSETEKWAKVVKESGAKVD